MMISGITVSGIAVLGNVIGDFVVKGRVLISCYSGSNDSLIQLFMRYVMGNMALTFHMS